MIKTIEVDWDDPSALKKVSMMLRARRQKVLEALGASPSKFGTNTVTFRQFLPVMERMIAVDDGGAGDHYVYFHCDPRRGLDAKRDIREMFIATQFPGVRHVPFYVGKGVGGRAHDLRRNGYHAKLRSSIIAAGDDVDVQIVRRGMTAESALQMEAALIDIMGFVGLSKHGLLVNLDEGQEKRRRRSDYDAADAAIVERILKTNGFN